MIRICLNGAERETPSQTVAFLLEELNLHQTRVAVEKNGEIVPRATYAQEPLLAGDKVEIVQFVGGG